jgi:hypothetical protein
VPDDARAAFKAPQGVEMGNAIIRLVKSFQNVTLTSHRIPGRAGLLVLGVAFGLLPAVGAHAQVFDNSNVGFGDDSATYAYNFNLSSLGQPQGGLGFETQVSDGDPGAVVSGTATATDTIGNATSETLQTQGHGVPTGNTASSIVSSDLSTGSVSLQLAGTGNGTVGATAAGYAIDSDVLTFNIPGATATTVTQIPLTFSIASNGAAPGNGYGSGTAYLNIDNGNATLLQGVTYTGLNPGDTVSGFSSESLADTGPGSAIFTADYAVTGASPQVDIGFYANGGAGLGASFNLAESLNFNLPAGITFTSQSGVFDTQVPEPTVVALLATVTSAGLLRRRRRGV